MTEKSFDFKYTKDRRLRGAMADADDADEIILIKNSSQLRATYQIRLLLYRAVQEGKVLILDIPKNCKIQPDLDDLIQKFLNHISVERC